MDLLSAKNAYIKRHNLILAAGIADNSRETFLDAAAVTQFQLDIKNPPNGLPQYPVPDGNTAITSAQIKAMADLNVRHIQAIDAAFVPPAAPYNQLLDGLAKAAANTMLTDALTALFKSNPLPP